MTQELKIKATLLDIENKTDKNGHPYFRLSLQGIPGRYFYAFSYYLPEVTWKTLVDTPLNFLNRQVLIAYQESSNKDQLGTFCKVQQIELA